MKFELHGSHIGREKKSFAFQNEQRDTLPLNRWADFGIARSGLMNKRYHCLATVTTDIFARDQKQLFQTRASYQLENMVVEMFGLRLSCCLRSWAVCSY